jgi:hypothetical protein
MTQTKVGDQSMQSAGVIGWTVGGVFGLVRQPKAKMIGGNTAVMRGKLGDHRTVEKRPGRGAMNKNDRFALAFIDIMHLGMIDGKVMRREGVRLAINPIVRLHRILYVFRLG